MASSLLPADWERLTEEAFKGELSDLGWKGKYKYDDEEVVALRGALDQHAGIPGMEFVVIKDVLDEERLDRARRGCEIAIREMVGRDPHRVGNRGSHRYSFGSSSAHFGLQDEWAAMIDPPPLMEVLEAIFGTKDFCSTGAGGGDYNTPGSVEYQNLHSDGGGHPDGPWFKDTKLEYHNDGNRKLVALDAPEDPELRYQTVNIRDLPVREYLVTANYPIEIRAGSDVGHTPHNGATRQIPNTQHLSTPSDGNTIPSEEEEELWMKMSVTCSCPAGSVLLRDNRAWHGGTPNLSKFTRAIPSARFTLQSPEEKLATIGPIGDGSKIPYETWQRMTEQGKHICRHIVAEPGEVLETPWKPDWRSPSHSPHQGQKVDNPFAGAKL